MRPSGAWVSRLVVAGSCLAWAGCGGGDVPDPDSDASAAPEQTSKLVDKSSEPAPEAPAAPQAPKAAIKPPGEASGPSAPAPAQDLAAAPEPPAPAPSSTPAVADAEKPVAAPAEGEATAATPPPTDPPAVKGDASGTEEMMRISASAPAVAPPPTTEVPASNTTPPPPVTASIPGPGAGGNLAPGLMPGSTRGEGPGRGGRGPGFGGANAPGAPGGATAAVATSPTAFNRPTSAVDAFLNALKSKSKDQLAEATARRSATEAVEKHRKIFAEIIEGSISDVELDEMAGSMQGYKVMYELPAKSTGRIGVVVGKQEGRDQLQRTVIVRKEREGWKVMDIEGVYDFKPVGNYRRPGRR